MRTENIFFTLLHPLTRHPSYTTKMVSKLVLEQEASVMLGRSPFLSTRTSQSAERSFRGMFGVTSTTASALWALLESTISKKTQPVHLLWTLLFLKVYSTKNIHFSIAKCDPKTFWKWVWYMVGPTSFKVTRSKFNPNFLLF